MTQITVSNWGAVSAAIKDFTDIVSANSSISLAHTPAVIALGTATLGFLTKFGNPLVAAAGFAGANGAAWLSGEKIRDGILSNDRDMIIDGVLDATSAIASVLASGILPIPAVVAGGVAIVVAVTAAKSLRDAGLLDPGWWGDLGEKIRTFLIPGYALERAMIDAYLRQLYGEVINPRTIDPLAIDLDSDGIETLGIAGNPVLFDHNGDGVRTGTGWLRPDDAWLVRDLDGNGLIDGGHELFGVDTVVTVDTVDSNGNPITYSRMALSGFDALRGLDTNREGVFNAADAAWGEVGLWQDLNSDGISQPGELITLASKNIVGIALNETPANTDLGNGNRVTGTAVVQRSAGPGLMAGTVDLKAGNLDLADNPFYREFSDTIQLTAAAQAAPEMGGSGWLRDLRQAASLGTAEAGVLQGRIDDFAAGRSQAAVNARTLRWRAGRRDRRLALEGVTPPARLRGSRWARQESPCADLHLHMSGSK